MLDPKTRAAFASRGPSIAERFSIEHSADRFTRLYSRCCLEKHPERGDPRRLRNRGGNVMSSVVHSETEIPTIVIRPSKGWISLQAARPLGVPGAALLPRVARHQGPLQADRPRRGLGHHPAVLHDGGLQPLLRQARQDAVRRHSVPDLCVRGPGPVDLLRQRADPVGQQPRRQRQPDPQGVLPAADDPDRQRARGPRGLLAGLRRAARDDGSGTRCSRPSA